MKKVLALMLALVLVLSLAACGNKVPVGTYEVVDVSGGGGMEMLMDFTTLTVKSDGSAEMYTDFGGGYSDTTQMSFDEKNSTVSFDETTCKYKVDKNRIIFTFDSNIKWVFEKK